MFKYICMFVCANVSKSLAKDCKWAAATSGER